MKNWRKINAKNRIRETSQWEFECIDKFNFTFQFCVTKKVVFCLFLFSVSVCCFRLFSSLINSMHLLESGDLSQTINDSQPRNRKPAKNCFQFASSPWFWSGDVIFDRWIVVTGIECFPKKKTKIAEIFFKKTKKIFFFCNLQFQSILFLLHAAVWTT